MQALLVKMPGICSVSYTHLDVYKRQTLLRLRYGLDGERPATQQQTAERLGISRSYVSRLEKRALARLMNTWRK